MAGKGDKYRPVDKQKYDANYDKIDWSKDVVDERCDTCNMFRGIETQSNRVSTICPTCGNIRPIDEICVQFGNPYWRISKEIVDDWKGTVELLKRKIYEDVFR